MALESMGYTTKTVDGVVEILWNSSYVAFPATLDTSAFTDGVCKAGTPITRSGMKATGSEAEGILLYDVYQDRPQATGVYRGSINTKVAEEHAGITIDEAVKTAIKNVSFM